MTRIGRGDVRTETYAEGVWCMTGKSASGYPGSFPIGFLRKLQTLGYWGDRRIHLCCGGVDDPDADRVDVQRVTIPGDSRGNRGHSGEIVDGVRQYQTTANIIADGRDTKLEGQSYDCVIIDPPYSASLASGLYGNEPEHYSGIAAFVTEAYRLVKPGGFIVTLSYEVPPLYADLQIEACFMVYQIPPVRNFSGCMVFRRPGERDSQGLQRWMG